MSSILIIINYNEFNNFILTGICLIELMQKEIKVNKYP